MHRKSGSAIQLGRDITANKYYSAMQNNKAVTTFEICHLISNSFLFKYTENKCESGGQISNVLTAFLFCKVVLQGETLPEPGSPKKPRYNGSTPKHDREVNKGRVVDPGDSSSFVFQNHLEKAISSYGFQWKNLLRIKQRLLSQHREEDCWGKIWAQHPEIWGPLLQEQHSYPRLFR